jgi:hypothetical protein
MVSYAISRYSEFSGYIHFAIEFTGLLVQQRRTSPKTPGRANPANIHAQLAQPKAV